MITINDDLSSHIVSDDGTQECFLASHNPETLVPFASAEEVSAFIPTVYANPNYWQPYVSPEERAQIEESRKAESNTARAKQELLDTDWCENASVRNTSFTPHLINADEFDAYRLQLRAILVNKVIDVESWPERPTTAWSST